MISIDIAEPFQDLVKAEALEQAAQAALQWAQPPAASEADLSIVVDDDEAIQTLNQQFLGIDAPTDVLSFPSDETQPDPESGRVYLGDIILSYPRAAEQSAAAGHPVQNEMQLLVIHGVLHLLGHDHADEAEKARMWALQAEVLQNLGITIARLPE